LEFGIWRINLMATKVLKCGIRKEPGCFYFLDSKGNVSKSKEGNTSATVVVKAGIKKQPGYSYFVDNDGDVSMEKGVREEVSVAVDRNEHKNTDNIQIIKCPQCAEAINIDAKICKHCGSVIKMSTPQAAMYSFGYLSSCLMQIIGTIMLLLGLYIAFCLLKGC
jgi:hypothetical protein